MRHVGAAVILCSSLLATGTVLARPPAKSAQVSAVLKSVLNRMEVSRAWQAHPKFTSRLSSISREVTSLKRWRVTKLEKKHTKISFDAYKITDRSGGFSHGFRVRGSIDKRGKADLDIWKLSDGFRSGGITLSRNKRQAKLWAGYDVGEMQVLTAKPMKLAPLTRKAFKE